jgi:hypothetical protein
VVDHDLVADVFDLLLHIYVFLFFDIVRSKLVRATK